MNENLTLSDVVYNIQQLTDILFAKENLIIINDEARYAHHVVALFKFFKMIDVIDFGSYIMILCGYALCGNH